MSPLSTLVAAAADALAVVESVGEAEAHVPVFISDCIPGGNSAPWCIEVRAHAQFEHPLFGRLGPHIDLVLPMLSLDPTLADYYERVAGHAAPCLDHQRFALGAQIGWTPETGQFAVRALLATDGLSEAALITRLRFRLRCVAGLTLLTAFRVWQLALRRDLPESQTDPMAQGVWRHMMALLDAAPEG